MMKQDHDTQLPDVIDQTAALNSFRCRHKHLLNLVSQTLTSLANSLLASSIIPEEVYQRVSNSNQAAFDRSVTLLDCIEARISSEPSDFKKVVQILQSDRFLQTLADGLVQSYYEHVHQLYPDTCGVHSSRVRTSAEEEVKSKLLTEDNANLHSTVSEQRFPYLKAETLTTEQREELIGKLTVESEDMRSKFAILVGLMNSSLQDNKISVSKLKVTFKYLELNELVEVLHDETDMNEAIFKAGDFLSFFDYETVKAIIKTHCADLQQKMESYESDFEIYCRRRLCEVPVDCLKAGVLSKTSNLYVKIDKNFKIKLSEVKRIEIRLSYLLGKFLNLLKVEKGCIKLVFNYLGRIKVTLPLNSQQEEELSEMRVLRLYDDNYEYYRAPTQVSSPSPLSQQAQQAQQAQAQLPSMNEFPSNTPTTGDSDVPPSGFWSEKPRIGNTNRSTQVAKKVTDSENVSEQPTTRSVQLLSDEIKNPPAKRAKQDHSNQLSDVINSTAALNSFRCQRTHMLNLVHPTLTSLANSLLASSIIPEDVYQSVSNSNQTPLERSVTLLDCIEARISSVPSDFKKVVQILQSDSFLQTLADGLVQSYYKHVRQPSVSHPATSPAITKCASHLQRVYNKFSISCDDSQTMEEYDTISKCTSQLVTALGRDIAKISHYLFKERFISDELFGEVLEPKSLMSDADKANKLMLQILNCVKLDSSKYYKLLNHWRQDKSYDDIVQILDSEYFGIPSHEQSDMNFDDVYKRLSLAKDKWHAIGCSLKVPTKWLDQFKSLSDPLLEVVTHWLKGARETLPSVDEVVSALREQGISVMEPMYYYDQQKEVKIKADSDVTSQLMRVQPKKTMPKEFEGYKLERKTRNIKREFARFLRELEQHMMTKEINISVIKTEIMAYDRRLRKDIEKTTSLHDIFYVLLPKTSFLDYDLIKILIDHGNTEIKKMFTDYKRKLQGFLEERMIEDPLRGEGSYVVVIDKIITEEITDWNQLQNRVKIILGHKNVTLLKWENQNPSKIPSTFPVTTVSEENFPSEENLPSEKNFPSEENLPSEKNSPSEENLPSEENSPSSNTSLSLQSDASVNSPFLTTSNMATLNNGTSALSESTYKTQHEELLPEESFSFFQDRIKDDLEFDILQMMDEAKKEPSSNSQLHIMASEGNLTVITEMIKNGHNPMEQDEDGNTAPHYAARNGHLNVVKYYVDELGCPTVSDKQNNTLLHSAVLGGHIGIVQYLLGKKVEAVRNDDEITPLHHACYHGHLDIVMELVQYISEYLQHKQDCNTHCANTKKITPLHHAAVNGHLSIIKYLTLDKKCDPTCTDSDGNTPLHVAAANGHVEVVKYLSHFFEDSLIRDKSINTSAHYAVSKGHLNVVVYLIGSGMCDPTIVVVNNLSLLHIAATSGHLHLVKYLTDIRDYNAYCQNPHNFTPMHAAAMHGHLSVIEYFESKKFYNLMCKDFYDFTPLHYAANGSMSVIEFISSIYNRNCETVGKNGQSALHIAAIAGQLDIVKYFIEKQSFNPSLLDKRKMSPLSLAAAKGHLSVVKYLIKHCDPMVTNINGQNAFHFAAQSESGHLETVQFLSSIVNYTPEMVDKDGHNALHIAARSGHVSVVRFLIFDKEYDPLCTDAAGITPFHAAAIFGHTAVIKFYILEVKCSPQTLDKNGNNILHSAAIGGSLDLVQHLIDEEYMNPFLPNAGDNTPLHVASVCGHLPLVKYFTQEKNCNPLRTNKVGNSPFTEAIRIGHVHIVQYFSSILKSTTRIVDSKGCNALHLAAIAGQVACVRYFIDKGYDPSCLDASGGTPLHYAAANGHIEVVKNLVEDNKCNPMSQSTNGISPLQLAAEMGHIDIVKYLFSQITAPEVLDETGSNSLHKAAWKGHLDIVQYLIENQNYNPSCFNSLYSTPLHFAATGGHVAVIEYLVQKQNCNIMRQDRTGATPLHDAVENGCLEAVKYILQLKRGYDATCKNNDNFSPLALAAMKENVHILKFLSTVKSVIPHDKASGCTALVVAVSTGQLDAVRYLIEQQGYDPSYLDSNNDTLLHSAASCGQLNVIKYLISNQNCDAMARNSNSLLTPLHYASYFGHLNIVRFYTQGLLCEPHVRDKTDSTPLHFAAQNGKLEIVKHLANATSSLDITSLYNDDKHLPIISASSGGNLEIVKFLEHWNDIHSVDIDGWSCLHHGALEGHLTVVQYLIDERSFDPAIEDFSAVTPLHLASWKGQLDIVSYLFREKGCTPLCKDKACDTPIHWAASEGHLEVVKFFVEVGCPFLVQGENNNTPLDYAIIYDHPNVKQYLQGLMQKSS